MSLSHISGHQRNRFFNIYNVQTKGLVTRNVEFCFIVSKNKGILKRTNAYRRCTFDCTTYIDNPSEIFLLLFYLHITLNYTDFIHHNFDSSPLKEHLRYPYFRFMILPSNWWCTKLDGRWSKPTMLFLR